eukprot:364250-Chlamydomonas_euryale.AAC.7
MSARGDHWRGRSVGSPPLGRLLNSWCFAKNDRGAVQTEARPAAIPASRKLPAHPTHPSGARLTKKQRQAVSANRRTEASSADAVVRHCERAP